MPVKTRDLPPNHRRPTTTDEEHPYEPLVDAGKAALTTRRNDPPPDAPSQRDDEDEEYAEDEEYDEGEAAAPTPRRGRGGRSSVDDLEDFISPQRPARTRRRATDTALIRGETIDWLIRWSIRLICLALWIVTFSGTVFALNGGWNAFIPPLSGVASGADPGQALTSLITWKVFWMIMTWRSVVGICIQVVITGIQFHHRTRKWSIWYIMSMFVSAGLTYGGFSDIAIPMFAVFFELFMAAQWAMVVSHVFLFGLSIGSDYVPEQALITK